MTALPATFPSRDREAEILDAALAVLSRVGIGGVSMRAVARDAEVSLGLTHYYFTDKTSLIAAVLRRIGEHDLAIVRPDRGLDPADRLRQALRRAVAPEFLQPSYLASRLQMWSLASVDATFAEINREFQRRYLDELTNLIVAANPRIGGAEAVHRAGEILVIQNGIWLTTAIIVDPDTIERSNHHCEQIAFAPATRTTT